MKRAIASVELFAAEQDRSPEDRTRLTLTITAPERSDGGGGWVCRVALANRHRPTEVVGADSVTALAAGLEQARAWLGELAAEGKTLFRARTGESRFELE